MNVGWRAGSVEEEEGPSICIARRREYTSNALSSLKLSREAVQVSLHTCRLRAATRQPARGSASQQ